MVNWFTIRFARAELINNDDFPFSKMHATHTKQRMHMGSSLKENHCCGTIISNRGIFIGYDLKMIQDNGVERILTRPNKKNKKTKQNPVPMPSRETIILQFYTLQHDYISTPYRKYTVLSFFIFLIKLPKSSFDSNQLTKLPNISKGKFFSNFHVPTP